MLLPRGLVAEVDLERYKDWVAATGRHPWLLKERRITLSGGPFDGWAWDHSLAPDLYRAEGGRYLPTLTFPEDGTYVWMPGQ